MHLLLDTNVFLWFLAGSDRLGEDARAAVEQAETVTISVVSLWEATVKASLGKLSLSADLGAVTADQGMRRLDIRDAHLAELAALPLHHRDPFDRMLIAQARAERLRIATADSAFGDYDVEVLNAR
jgi:PIN domain nuclease of toxin-antitoxin system